jgi:excinuclease Cho
MRPRVTSIGLVTRARPFPEFQYPDHIDRKSLEALPRLPGVYLFLDRSGAALYIGKSVSIRARVLSHLRTPEEAAMLAATARVDHVRTAGEIGALLLESRLIKEMQPPHNALLRSIRDTYALALDQDDSQPQVCGSTDVAPGRRLYGLFGSRAAADEGLRALLRRHGLCPALLGLEQRVHGRACFAHQIGRCRGACIGIESQDAHAARLRQGMEQMQAMVWPFEGPVGIVEEGEDMHQVHLVDRWAYLGTLDGRRGKRRRLRLPKRPFIDIDTYRILAAPILGGQLQLLQCRIERGVVSFAD